LQFENLGQRPGVAEGIRIGANFHRAAEQLLEDALAVEPLADKRLSAGNVDVRLDPPASHHRPASFFNACSDLLQIKSGSVAATHS
jgi:hypothetical protein